MTSFNRRQEERKVFLRKKRNAEKKALKATKGGLRSTEWQNRKLIIRQNVAEREFEAQERAERRRDATT